MMGALDELSWPVLGFRGPYFMLYREPAALTTQYLRYVTSGQFQANSLVDVRGRVYRIASAKPKGVSILQRLVDPLYGQRVQVEVQLEPTGAIWPLDKVRRAIKREFKEWDGWQSREDYDEIAKGMDDAKTTEDLIVFLRQTLDKR
jgi:hypothetical protein